MPEQLVIASQLDPVIHETVQTLMPDVRLLKVPPGVPDVLPPEASAFFAAPHRVAGALPLPPRADWIGRMKWIQLSSAGADGYPDWYFNAPVVTSSRGPAARPVAEFALAAVFAHSKRMPSVWIHDAAQWKSQPLASVRGATLGVVGFGAIGREVAAMGAALGMRVLVSRNSGGDSGMTDVRVAPLSDVLAEADHLVIAAASTPQTRHLINHDALRKMKRGVHLINVARGTLLDQEALREALDGGWVDLATLDVADPEPLPPGHWLYTHPRVRLSPHLSSHVGSLRKDIAEGFVANLGRFMRGEPLHNIVDRAKGY